MNDTPFSKAYDAAQKAFPQWSGMNPSVIHVWLSNDCDVDLDILPTIEAIAKKKPDLNNLSYLTPIIKSAKETRLRAEAMFTEAAALKPIDDAKRAAAIAFKIRKVGFKVPHEERWLAEYEAVNGEVRV